MNKISTWFYKNATWHKTTILAIITAFIIFIVFPALTKYFSSTDIPLQMMDTSFSYTPEEVLQNVADYTDSEREGYILISLSIDFIYPMIYAFCLSFLLSMLFKEYANTTNPLRLINLLPFLAMEFDFLENVMLITLSFLYPDAPFTIAKIASIATPLKWGTLMVAIMIAAFRFSFQRGQQRRK